MLAARVEQKNGTYLNNIQGDPQSSGCLTPVAVFGICPDRHSHQPLSDRERLAKGLSRLVALAEAAEQIAHLGEKDAFDSMKSAFRRTAKRIGPTLQ
jgi:hypothetical protein